MQTIEQWLNELKANGRSIGTIENYGKILKRLQEHKPLNKITKDDLVDYFANSDVEDTTKVGWAVTIKKFFKEQSKPEVVEWLKLKRPKEKFRPEDIPTPDDVNKMIDTTDSPYWKANIAFTFECGGRIEEVLATKWDDFKDYKVKVGDAEQTFLSVSLYDFKSGQYRQPIILPFSGQYIRNLKAYAGGKPKDRVFNKSYRQTHAMFVRIGKDAGLPMNTSPHKLRHASATDMERKGFSDSAIRKKHGWTPTSTTPARYKHLSNTDVINETLVRNGVLIEKKAEITNIKRAEPNPLIDTAQLVLDLKEENAQIKNQIAEREKHFSDMINQTNEMFRENLQKIADENERLREELEELKKARQT